MNNSTTSGRHDHRLLKCFPLGIEAVLRTQQNNVAHVRLQRCDKLNLSVLVIQMYVLII